MDIFFYEAFAEETRALKSFLPEHIRAGFTENTLQENHDMHPPAAFISTRTQSVIPSSWEGLLSGILTRSTGFDHIERFLSVCSKRVPAGYLPLYCSRAVAEQAMLLWMGLLRKLPQQIRNFSAFNRDGLTGSQCTGKVLLAAGVGNIGIEICRIAGSLGMRVLGVDIVHRYEEIDYIPIEEGLKRADIIVCSMNLTEDNSGYFNYGLLKKAKPGAVFVNIARGELSPTKDLLRLLEEGHLSGIGLDVFEKESELAPQLRAGGVGPDQDIITATLELGRRSNVILTPHNAFNTHEALEKKAGQSIEQILHFLQTGTFLWPVP